MTFIDKCGPEGECKAVCGIYNEKKECKASATQHGAFIVNFTGLDNMRIVYTGQRFLGAESLGGADGGDDFFRKASAV